MSDDAVEELPDPGRRACVIWFEDATNTVSVDAPDFTWLELPELFRIAQDWAEFNAPVPTDLYETEGEPDE